MKEFTKKLAKMLAEEALKTFAIDLAGRASYALAKHWGWVDEDESDEKKTKEGSQDEE